MKAGGAAALAVLLLLVLSGEAKAKLILGEPMTDDEMKDFASAMRAIGVDPAIVIAVYNLESRMHPHALNTTSGAQGLAQLMPATLRVLGYQGDTARFHALSLREQLPWVVKLLQSQVGALGEVPATPARLMHLQLHPAGIQERLKTGTRVYTNPEQGYLANKALDHGAKGYIDESDLELAISDNAGVEYHAAMAQLARVA